MKAVLKSIKPKYCELIASGIKTVEIRKNRPKIDTPFKVYIYQTKQNWIYKILKWLKLYQGKVIGEFVCDRIDDFFVYADGAVRNWNYTELYKSCLKYWEITEYIGTGKFGYAWHISDLVIYDEPKELSEFKSYNLSHNDCWYADMGIAKRDCKECMHCVLTKPPQSWCYVEQL